MLRSKFFSSEQVEAIVKDYHNAGLEAAEVTMLEYTEKVTKNAYKVVPEDIEKLRSYGFSDDEILDIAIVAGWRAFYSKVLDAVGTDPDMHYLEMEAGLRSTLTVGRAFGEGI